MTDSAQQSTEDYVRALEASEGRVELERPRPEAAVLRLADPANRNALGGPLTVELRCKLAALCAEPELRAIVLTGTGRFFSVGGDWKLMTERAHTYAERAEGTTGLWYWIRNEFGGIARLITQTDKVVIAALNGDAAGVALAGP